MLGAGASKRRQVDAFLRVLQAAVADADLPAGRPLRVVDLGCGNAYLSFAAYRFLAAVREVLLTGIDLATADARTQQCTGRTSSAGRTRCGSWPGRSSTRRRRRAGDVVLALHACDTATDDALAQAVRWAAPVVLASPCCHHDLQRQMSARRATPAPYGLVTRHNILRERLGDVLTDAVRAALLRRVGYRVEVVQFVSAEYTPRNTMIRAVRTAGGAARQQMPTPSTRRWSPTGASRRTCRRCSPTTLPLVLARSRRSRGCCSRPPSRRGGGADAAGPGPGRVQRTGASRRTHPGVLWTHNDGGSVAQV